MTSVAVVGTGIIGKRLAAALSMSGQQLADRDSLEPYLAGIALRGPNVFAAARPEIPVFAMDGQAADRLRDVGIGVCGDLGALLAAADVVVDCGPARTGATRASGYAASGTRAIFCGGERDAGLGPLVHSALNPAVAARHAGLRLLSCNTTALARVLAGIGPGDVRALDATILRCSTDTDKAAKGITNGAVFAAAPSHHGSDLGELAPGPVVRTVAVTVPMTAGHVMHARVSLRDRVGAADAIGRLREAGRVDFLDAAGPVHTSRLKQQSSMPWHDRYHLQVLPIEEGRMDNSLELWLSLDNQAITIPEALDLIQLARPGTRAEDAIATSDRILRRHALSTHHCACAPSSGSRP